MSLANMLRPRIVEVGKIKIGGLSEKVRKARDTGREYRTPQKYDHFRIVTLQRNPAGDLIPDQMLTNSLIERYGDPDKKLRQLPITLLSDEPDDVMQSAWCWYGKKKLGARSDGETLTWFADPKTLTILAEPRVEPWKPEHAEMAHNGVKLFKKHTVLNCVVVSGESRWGGVYKLRTTSTITGDQLYGSLVSLRALTSGFLRGLPLMLVLRPMTVTPAALGGKSTTVYVVHIELRGADLQSIQQLATERAQFQLANTQQMRQIDAEYRKLLRAPGESEGDAEITEVGAEFHPEEDDDDADETPPLEIDPVAVALGLKPTAVTAVETAAAPAEAQAAATPTAAAGGTIELDDAAEGPATAEVVTPTVDRPALIARINERIAKLGVSALTVIKAHSHGVEFQQLTDEQLAVIAEQLQAALASQAPAAPTPASGPCVCTDPEVRDPECPATKHTPAKRGRQGKLI